MKTMFRPNCNPITTLVVATVIVVTCSSCSDLTTGQPPSTANPERTAKVREGDEKPIIKERDEARITMSASTPVRLQPEPDDLPEFRPWEVEVQYKNEGDKEIVLYPYFEIEVFDAAGKIVETDANMGIGFRSDDWIVDHEKAFLIIPPGQTKKIVVPLCSYVRLIDGIGWEFKTPGTYKLVLTYQFDRKSFEKDIAPWLMEGETEWAKRPERLWNRAIEMRRSVEVKLEVTE